MDATTSRLLSLLLDIALRAAVLGAAAVALDLALSRRAASTRHSLYLALLAALLALPVLAAALPPIYLWTAEPALLAPAPVAVSPAAAGAPALARQHSRTAAWPVLLLAAYLMPALALLLRAAASVRRARRMLAEAEPLRDARIAPLIEQLCHRLAHGYPPPEVRVSSAAEVPYTAGYLHPAIVLPACWSEWDDFRLRAVLAHEMTHIRRADWLVAALAQLVRALYWFHPLAWFAHSRLAALAEEACDAAALAQAGDPARYASILFDFASRLQTASPPSTAMARSSRVGARIERILEARFTHARPLPTAAALALVLLAAPILYAAAAVQSGPAPVPPIERSEMVGHQPLPGAKLIPGEAAELEARLARDPHDLDARAKLLGFYFSNGFIEPWLKHLAWAIDNHPEAALHDAYPSMVAADPAMVADSAARQRISDLWRRKAVENPASVDVLLHAAQFFTRLDPAESQRLLEAARTAAPGDARPLNLLVGRHYAVLMWLGQGSPELRRKAEERVDELVQSRDAALVGQVALSIPGPRPDAQVSPQFAEVHQRVETARAEARKRLLERAATLDPANPKWNTAPAEAPRLESPPRRIAVGGGVLPNLLLEAPEPVYPPLALQARIQGNVRFSVILAKDGTVANLTLVSGHPLLVQAGVDAVRRYRYRPTLLNGEAVEVISTVEVVFRLPQ